MSESFEAGGCFVRRRDMRGGVKVRPLNEP